MKTSNSVQTFNGLLLLFLRLHICHSANILGIFPVVGKSHFFFHKGVMNSLVDAGHNVTFISPFPESNTKENFTFIDSTIDREESEEAMEADFKSMSILQFIRVLNGVYEKYCYDILQIMEKQNFLNTDLKIFDVMFVEMLPLYECYLPMAKRLNIPVIATVSMRPSSIVDEKFGNPHPLIDPSPISPYSPKMTFLQRLENLYENILVHYLMKYIWGPTSEQFIMKFFPDYFLHGQQEISLLFNNNHASIFSTPAASNVIQIAGIHLSPIKPLPRDLMTFMDNAEDGVILFSLGSVSKSNVIGTEYRVIFRDIFAELSQLVIWKFEEKIENLTENVWISNWIPQRDILAHKNIKAFISHGGISSSYEAISAGVPLILFPLFGDQISNAAFFSWHKVGLSLDLKTLTKEILSGAIKTILNDNSYAENMKMLSKKFWDRPMSPQESVVYWTEYVLQHNGTQHLKSVIAATPFYQYFLLDVCLGLVFIFSVFFVIPLALKYLYCLISKKTIFKRKII